MATRPPTPKLPKRADLFDRPEVVKAIHACRLRIAANLRRLRAAEGWSQEVAAEKIGIHAIHLVRLEGGQPDVKLSTLVAAALAYNIEPRALLRPQRTRRR